MSEGPPELPGPSNIQHTGLGRAWFLSNPFGPEYGSSLPLLLRRVADQLDYDGFDPEDFLGLIVNEEVTEHGPWYQVGVFFASEKQAE